ncbi:MAG: molybdopterin molybdotransferase MoeA [Rhizobiaceae bacterium]|nr:molybdopterin molybdotransferase MoeA [Rhizobiaceae bacterium]
MALVPVADALARLLDDVTPCGAEDVRLADSAGRILAAPLRALRTQPPFDASAMDGYAVRAADVATVPAQLRLIGEAAAGRRFARAIGQGEAVRIFTGAPLPAGADTIVIQENARVSGDTVEVLETVALGRHIRRRGLDFSEGDALLQAGRRLDPAAVSLAASANHTHLSVTRRPVVAIIATGDELLPPGSRPGPDQIISSNAYGVAAGLASVGAHVVDLGITPDRVDAIAARLREALAMPADVIVTLGGASVGDHDLVHAALTGEGMKLDFWKIAMRPGKPLMFGRLGSTRCIGLPGNPVASLVCTELFLKPLVARLGGADYKNPVVEAVLGADMAENDLRQDYVRARLEGTDAALVATPFPVQDSSMLRTLADSGALIIRAPFAPAAVKGSVCQVLRLH